MSEERKRQAFSMYARGKSEREIASVLGTTSQSVKKWVQEQRTVNHSTLQKIHKEDYVGLTLQRFSEIRDETWTGYSNSQKPGDRVKYLKLAMDLELKEAALLQDLGFLEGQEKKQELSISIVAQLKGEVGLSRLDALALSVLSKRTGMTPEALMNMQGSARNVFAMPEAVGLKSIDRALPTPSPVEVQIIDQPVNGTNGNKSKGE